MDASIRLDHQLLAVEGDHTVHAMLELTAPALEQKTDRPPLNLALVIDRSGSMGGMKLEHTKAAVEHLIKRLAPQDQVAIVAYDDEVDLLAALGSATRSELLPHVGNLYPRGSTNLSGGWLKGAEELGRAGDQGVRKVLLLTDGQANVGIVDTDTLVGMARQMSNDGRGTTTIGYGADFNEELLTQMADAGAGNSYFAASPEDAPGIFAQEFEDLATMVAQNLSVEIRPTEDVKLVGVLNQFPATGVPGGIQLALGDIYSEENRRVVFELHIPGMAQLGVHKVAEVVVRYTTVGDEIAQREITIPLIINLVSADEAAATGPDADVVEEVLILKAAQAQREARRLADEGDYKGAQQLLRDSAGEIKGLASHSARREELINEARLLEGHAETMAQGRWDARSKKAMHYEQHRMSQARRKPKPRTEDE